MASKSENGLVKAQQEEESASGLTLNDKNGLSLPGRHILNTMDRDHVVVVGEPAQPDLLAVDPRTIVALREIKADNGGTLKEGEVYRAMHYVKALDEAFDSKSEIISPEAVNGSLWEPIKTRHNDGETNAEQIKKKARERTLYVLTKPQGHGYS